MSTPDTGPFSPGSPAKVDKVDKVAVATKHPGVFVETSELEAETGASLPTGIEMKVMNKCKQNLNSYAKDITFCQISMRFGMIVQVKTCTMPIMLE